MGGQPSIRGLRITVKRVLEILGGYTNRAEFFADYPDLEEEDLRQALAFAAAHLDDRIEILDYASWMQAALLDEGLPLRTARYRFDTAS